MNLFIGKFSTKFPEQIENKYYAGGVIGSVLYGGVKVGDYIFPSYGGKILGLWRAREYTQLKNTVAPNRPGVLHFDVIKEYDDVNVSNDFTRYKHFIHNLDLVNKATKSTKGLGFIPIATTKDCPSNPEDINFKTNIINIYVALKNIDITYNEGDIRVTIDDLEEMRILSIDRFQHGEFKVYEELNDLYEKRNEEDGKYTIKELNEYSLKDQAIKKRNFLIALIEELNLKGYMKVSNSIRLYDNLLVGRKKTVSKSISPIIPQENIEDEDLQYEIHARLLNFNPNLILYGPPGTGKTYATSKIIDHFEKKYFSEESSFNKAENEKRVQSITFHQSYSYEEFIEGIRPVLNEDGANKLGYKLENGVFKELCMNAEKELIKRDDNFQYVDMINLESRIWKVSLGERKTDSVFNECIKKDDIAINWLDELNLSNMNYSDILTSLKKDNEFISNPTQDSNSVNAFVNEMAIGDIVLVYDSPKTIRMIGIIKSEYRYEPEMNYKHRRSVEWFKKLNYPIDIHKQNGFKNLSKKTIYELTRISISDVINMVANDSSSEKLVETNQVIRPYYLIIDEINRGNISKIFGELITLIEQDKRGVYKTLLPYSKKEFTVPINLNIIGTMNTADRSIAVLDTALRRRFTFIEIEPNSQILTEYDNPIINDTIDLSQLLDSLNEKIMEKYDRDHRIGHAYFMNLESLYDLYQTWYYKVIPLLNEYFYNDVGILKSIVGNSFYDKYGNVNHLSLKSDNEEPSEFEEELMKIYKEKNNG